MDFLSTNTEMLLTFLNRMLLYNTAVSPFPKLFKMAFLKRVPIFPFRKLKYYALSSFATFFKSFLYFTIYISKAQRKNMSLVYACIFPSASLYIEA